MKHTAYLSLGSNQGNRLAFMQQALMGLEQMPLILKAQSHIFETPAWGFEGPSFLNACVVVETNLTPKELLAQMLRLEEQLGRYRTASVGYDSRTIDLDLLGYENEVIQEEGLTLPHPLLHKREFVLRPLAEIAPTWNHPVLSQTPQMLLTQVDKQDAIQLPFSDWLPPIFKAFPFIAIEGNIGSGKTTLMHQIATAFGVTPFLENFSTNPHLAPFYKNPQAHAKAAETFFLEARQKAIKTFWNNQKKPAVVADFSIYKSLVFAKQNLTPTDFEVYLKQYKTHLEGMETPQLILYLDASSAFCFQRIKERARSFEQNITMDYLQNISAGYTSFFAAHSEIKVLKINVENRDFRNDPQHFQWLLRRIIAASISK